MSYVSMYFMITSSVTFPLLATKNPRAQTCRPQHWVFKCLNSISNFRDVLPLIRCINWLGEMCGGTDANRCTWSLLTWPRMISTSNSAQICRDQRLTLTPTSPPNNGFRYFVIHTKCNLMSKRVWLVLRHILIWGSPPWKIA